MKKTVAYIFLFIGILLVIIILFNDKKISEKIANESKQNFRREISGVVSSVSQNRGTISLRLKRNTNNPYYFGVTRNYKLRPYDLNDFIRPGDSVYKDSNSNEFFVFRNNEKFRFILEESINKSRHE